MEAEPRRVLLPDAVIDTLDDIARSNENELETLLQRLNVDSEQFSAFVAKYGLEADEATREISEALVRSTKVPSPAHGQRNSLMLGDIAPDFEAETTEGVIRFHDWIGDAWAVLFSHPKDFTPISATEIGYVASIKPEFEKRGVKIIGLSVDPVQNHSKWADDLEKYFGFAPNYPLIGDADLKVSNLYGMLPPRTVEGETTWSVENQTLRTVFVIGPDKRIKLVLVYPLTTGRNFDEILRVIDSLQLTAKHKVATPVNWKQGEDVIIAGTVSNEDAKKIFPQGWTLTSPYIRIVRAPEDGSSEAGA